MTSTTFKLQVPGEYSEPYSYSRYGNPTRDHLEGSLAKLEKANFARVFSSKTAAALALISSLKAGDRIIFINCTSGSKFKKLCVHLQLDFVDSFNAEEFKNVLKEDTRIVWIETPSTESLEIVDIENVSRLARARTKATLVVDNTIMTSSCQKPLAFGADAVLYSLGEFVAGHSDVMMGAICTNDEKLNDALHYQQYASGMIPSAFDCFIVERSLKTLSLRMERHSENACKVAEFLERHRKVECVYHPSLKSHKDHKLAMMQSSGYPGVLTFRMKEAAKFLQSLKIFNKTDAIGGSDCSAHFLTNFNSPHDPGDLIRLSMGLERADEIIEDLQQALNNL